MHLLFFYINKIQEHQAISTLLMSNKIVLREYSQKVQNLSMIVMTNTKLTFNETSESLPADQHILFHFNFIL